MGEVVQLRTQATANHRDARESGEHDGPIERSISVQAEHEAKAQRAAEAHLAACQEAMYAADVADGDTYPESPAIGPYCGCDTCIVRETLHAAWPHVIEAAKEALAREAG